MKYLSPVEIKGWGYKSIFLVYQFVIFSFFTEPYSIMPTLI